MDNERPVENAPVLRVSPEIQFGCDLLADRLMIKPDERGEQKTAGGIIIPASLKDNPRPERGIVVAIGQGTKEKPTMSVQVGDVVLVSQYAGSKVKLNGINYSIMRETDIWARIDADVQIEQGE